MFQIKKHSVGLLCFFSQSQLEAGIDHVIVSVEIIQVSRCGLQASNPGFIKHNMIP